MRFSALDEEHHPRARGREQRVVLAVVLASPLAPGDEHDDGPGHGRGSTCVQRRELVAHHRPVEQHLGRRGLVEDDAGEDRGDARIRRTRLRPRRLLRIQAGTSTAPSSATPAAASSAIVGESASQSTVGVSITRMPPAIERGEVLRAETRSR